MAAAAAAAFDDDGPQPVLLVGEGAAMEVKQAIRRPLNYMRSRGRDMEVRVTSTRRALFTSAIEVVQMRAFRAAVAYTPFGRLNRILKRRRRVQAHLRRASKHSVREGTHRVVMQTLYAEKRR